jgi:putative ABC transport system substrate-binding protein
VQRPGDLSDAFALLLRERPDALTAAEDPLIVEQRQLIIDFTARHRLPTVFGGRVFVDAGGLMSYGTDWADLLRRSATLVDKILRGATPGDLPIEQPTKFELVINLKTAKALGLTIPPALLQRADEVIE